MQEHGSNVTEAPPAHDQLIEMATGYWVSRVVYMAARLSLADHLSKGPKSAEELAPTVGAHPGALHRLMRTLASLGILTERSPGQFGLTALGEALRADAPGPTRSSVLALAGPMFWRAWEHLPHSIETGETGMEKAWGKPIFDYLAEHPDLASEFSETMVGFHGNEPPAVAEAYDFFDCETVVDVGGATGNMLAAILGRFPGLRGVLFDLPHVVGDAPALLEERGITDRVTIEPGDFFERVPAGGDAYVLSHIIHDWSESQCLTILGNCRKAMNGNGRLLIVEMVLPPGDTPHPGKVLDMVMLVIPGGEERTEEQYRELLDKASFRLTRVVPTNSAVSVVEAVPA